MKNKEFQKLLKKNKSKSNSGFTLTELLVGLVMSIFVVGALGFGLMTVLRTTRSETSKVAARNEASRALSFISDEVRRARTIETNLANANIGAGSGTGAFFDVSGTNINSATGTLNTNASTNKKIVFALDIPEVSTSGTFDSDDDATTTNERIIYYLKSASGTNWKGPLVLYRWGPPLDTDGSYSDGTWQEEALIDGINDTHISNNPCTAGNLTPPILPSGTTPTLSSTAISSFASGFYACVEGNNTAQLYLTGGIDTATGATDTTTGDTKVVARARTAPANRTDIFNSIRWSFDRIGDAYHCGTSGTWRMRTDFGNNASDTDDTISWIPDPAVQRQAQPIEVDPTKPLTITSSPIGAIGCNSIGNDYRYDSANNTDELDADGKLIPTDGTEVLSQYDVKVSHTINFGDPVTFNGDRDNNVPYNVTQVDSTNPGVQFLKRGSNVPQYGGFDENNNGDLSDPNDQPSLGKFLYDQKRAVLKNPGDNPNLPGTQFVIPETSSDSTIKLLGDDQRIIAFEVGQTATTINGNDNPGFDLQDNIFIITSDIFKRKFPPGCFTSGCPAPDAQ